MSVTSRYSKPSDLPVRIPVFPLAGAILLPRVALPLNIFEPRYLAMIDDVVGGDRVLGIIQPAIDPESAKAASSALKRVGCAGRLSAYQELDDGRILITLSGIARFTVTSEVPTTKPYRMCAVDYTAFAEDFETGSGESEINREALLVVLKNYLERRQLKVDWRSIANASTEFLINTLSVISPYGPEEKQALLEAENLRKRADVLMALAEMELASGAGGSGRTLQ